MDALIQKLPKEVSVRKAAEALGVCADTVLDLIRAGELKARNKATPGSIRPNYAVLWESVVARRTTYDVVTPQPSPPARRSRSGGGPGRERARPTGSTRTSGSTFTRPTPDLPGASGRPDAFAVRPLLPAGRHAEVVVAEVTVNPPDHLDARARHVSDGGDVVAGLQRLADPQVAEAVNGDFVTNLAEAL